MHHTHAMSHASHARSESFACIAFAAHYKATGTASSKDTALKLFDFFVKWCARKR
jgi:hypothetical protein